MTATRDADFVGWRRAWLSGEVDQGLVAFVSHVASTAAGTRTLPDSLSPTGRWDRDSLEDVVQAFWEKRLLDGALNQAFDRVRNAAAFSRYLENTLRNWLIDEARAGGVPRIASRIQTLLEDDDVFVCYQPSSKPIDAYWGLSQDGWDQLAPFVGEDEALLAQLYAVGDIERLPPTQSRRADPILSNSELLRVVVALFERVQAWLTPQQLNFGFRGRFPTFFPTGPSAEAAETLQAPDDEPTIPATIDAEDAARQAIAAMSERQLAILRGRLLENLTLEQLASDHGCSRGTADNEFRRASAILRQFATADDVQMVWKKILELSS